MHKFHHENAHRLHSEERMKILPPDEILKSCGLSEGMTMVDVGCGSGYFTIPASRIVGESGRVYAVDIQEEMLNRLKERGLPSNVISILARGDYDFPLDDGISDFTFIAFVTHENEDLEKFFSEIKRITKDEGRVVILEWKKQHEESGPPYEERIAMEEILGKLEKFGFRIVEFGELNQSHYKVICVKR